MFSVWWVKSASDELASLWLNADSRLRQEITQAVHKIDVDLSKDPENLGESRTANERIHFHGPIGVRFEVEVPNKVVVVLQVWTFSRRQ